MKILVCSGIGAVVLLSIVSGCAAQAEVPIESSGESDLVGVTDIEAFETAFGLTKDTQLNGKWTRGDEILTAGECYREHLGPGAPEPANWQFRRYTKGAVFFRKLNSGPASGDRRPLACFDSDTQTGKLDGFMLDAAIRYKFGAPTHSEGAAGHAYLVFEHGAVETRDADHLCGFFAPNGEPSLYPGLNAWTDEIAKCAPGADCTETAYNACKWWSTIDAQAETIDRPSYGNSYLVGFPLELSDLSPVQAMMAYKYSLKKGTEADVFSLKDDPIGLYSGSDSTGAGSVARYARLDVHHVFFGGKEGVYVTPKSSDTKIAASAVASCERTVDSTTGVTTGTFECKGL